jgi:hypothetical protein
MLNKKETEMELTAQQVEQIVNDAMTSAAEAAKRALAQYGDRDCCGFAWVNVYDYKGTKIRANSKMGRALTAAGVRKDYQGAYCLWNPSKAGVQSMGILEAGAYAAAEVFKANGFTAYAGSRMD